MPVANAYNLTEPETCFFFSDGQGCSGMETLAAQPQQQSVRLGQWNEPGPFLQGAVPPFALPHQLAHLGQPGMRIPQQLLRPNWGMGTTVEDEPRAPMPRSVQALCKTGHHSMSKSVFVQYILFGLNVQLMKFYIFDTDLDLYCRLYILDTYIFTCGKGLYIIPHCCFFFYFSTIATCSVGKPCSLFNIAFRNLVVELWNFNIACFFHPFL